MSDAQQIAERLAERLLRRYEHDINFALDRSHVSQVLLDAGLRKAVEALERTWMGLENEPGAEKLRVLVGNALDKLKGEKA